MYDVILAYASYATYTKPLGAIKMTKRFEYSPPFKYFVSGVAGIIGTIIWGLAIFTGDIILIIAGIIFGVMTLLVGIVGCSTYFRTSNWNYIEITDETISFPQETENGKKQGLIKFNQIDAIINLDTYDYAVLFRVGKYYSSIDKEWMNNKEFEEVRDTLLAKVSKYEDAPDEP